MVILILIPFTVSAQVQDKEVVMEWNQPNITEGFAGWSIEKQNADGTWGTEFEFITYDPAAIPPYTVERTLQFPVGTVEYCFRAIAKNVIGQGATPSEVGCLQNTFYVVPDPTNSFTIYFKVNP